MFQELIENLRSDTFASLQGFRPELAICVTIVVMLLARIPRWRVNSFYIALAGSLVALVLSAPWNYLGESVGQGAGPFGKEIFTGMLIFDGLTVYFRAVLMLFAVC